MLKKEITFGTIAVIYSISLFFHGVHFVKGDGCSLEDCEKYCKERYPSEGMMFSTPVSALCDSDFCQCYLL